MEEPNCHTAKTINTHIAVSSFPSHTVLEGSPIKAKSAFITPSLAQIRFHKIATATLEPIIDGK